LIQVAHITSAYPLISITGAVMFGRERPQTGILIETTPELQIDVHNATQLAELRNKIW
jgi:hypothetical protein